MEMLQKEYKEFLRIPYSSPADVNLINNCSNNDQNQEITSDPVLLTPPHT